MSKTETMLDSRREYIRKSYNQARTSIRDIVLTPGAPSQEADISEAYVRSTQLLGNYVTLDLKHCDDIMSIVAVIRGFARDRSRKRPLNIVMQAEPGSGKSHLVKCLARGLVGVDASAVDFNMSSLQSIDDLVQPLDAVRNLKVIDRLPLLFLDEFDSDPARYALLLPLLWDGALHVGHRDLKLGKVVIILAGSGTKIETAMKTAKGMHPSETQPDSKLVDLLSRINGGAIEIPPLDLVDGERDRRVDKVCLTIALLEERFGRKFETVPWALLHFVALAHFRYGIRSISHLVDLLTAPQSDEETEIKRDNLTLPITSVEKLKASSLVYHLVAEDGPAAIVEQWKKATETDAAVRVRKHEEENILEI